MFNSMVDQFIQEHKPHVISFAQRADQRAGQIVGLLHNIYATLIDRDPFILDKRLIRLHNPAAGTQIFTSTNPFILEVVTWTATVAGGAIIRDDSGPLVGVTTVANRPLTVSPGIELPANTVIYHDFFGTAVTITDLFVQVSVKRPNPRWRARAAGMIDPPATARHEDQSGRHGGGMSEHERRLHESAQHHAHPEIPSDGRDTGQHRRSLAATALAGMLPQPPNPPAGTND